MLETLDYTIRIGSTPTFLYFLVKCFLTSRDNNSLTAEVTGGRKRENGLVVPCAYRARTEHLRIAEKLHVELVKAKETYRHMDINVNDFQLKKKVCF